jgi:hypothetical protein
MDDFMEALGDMEHLSSYGLIVLIKEKYGGTNIISDVFRNIMPNM